MQIHPVNIIQSIIVFQAIFGVIILWNNFRYRGFVYLLVFMTIVMIFNLLEETVNTREIFLVTPIFLLGKGPFFYLFVYCLVYPGLTNRSQYFWHALPMFLVIPFTVWPQLVIGLGTLSQLFYAYLTIKLVVKYHRASFSERSDAEALKLNWILYVLAAFLVLGVFDLVRLNLQPYISLNVNLLGQLFENTSVLLLFSYLIFKAIQQPNLFDGLSKVELGAQTQESNEDLTEHSQLQAVYDSLEELIKTRSLHHKPRLCLNDLSQETGLNAREISRAINIIGKRSFCDYINRLRILDVKAHLSEHPQSRVNLLEVSLEYGFNSKSTFNSVFKREIGMTPTQYLKNLNG